MCSFYMSFFSLEYIMSLSLGPVDLCEGEVPSHLHARTSIIFQSFAQYTWATVRSALPMSVQQRYCIIHRCEITGHTKQAYLLIHFVLLFRIPCFLFNPFSQDIVFWSWAYYESQGTNQGLEGPGPGPRAQARGQFRAKGQGSGTRADESQT